MNPVNEMNCVGRKSTSEKEIIEGASPNKAKSQIRKRALCLFVLLGLIGIATVVSINFYVKQSVEEHIFSEEEAASVNADCILVLGAGVWAFGKPSPMLEDRLLKGIELYEIGASSRLLMSGDHGQNEYDEVNTMKQFAIDQQVPSSDVFMDHAGFSTYESLYRARDIFQAKKIIIVTQKYHLYRALYIAKSLGLEAYGVPSDPRQYAGQRSRDVREELARVKDFFALRFLLKPTYLGDPIPITGDGDATND